MEKTKKEEKFLMSPKVDFCFKELMQNSKVRKGFLAAVLELAPEEIEKTTLLPTHLSKEHPRDKLGILDVQVEMRDGTRIDIEVNVAPFAAWPERSLFYLGKMYVGQIESGQEYDVLKKCVHIGILDFTLFRGEKEYYSRFHLWEDQRNFLYSSKLEIHIIELPKLKRFPQPETELLNWMRFVSAEKEEEMERMAKRNGYIQTAYDELKMLSADERKRLAYEEELKARRDYVSIMKDNLRRGRRSGKELGQLQKLISITLKKQRKGLSPQEIAELLEEEEGLIEEICRYGRENPGCTDEEAANALWEEPEEDFELKDDPFYIEPKK